MIWWFKISALEDILNDLVSSTEFKTFIGFLSAIITAVIGKVAYDMIKAPKLVSSVPKNDEPHLQTFPTGVRRAFYHIVIKNERRRVIDRLPANNARVKITFKDNAGKTLFSLAGKWDWTPQPLSVQLHPLTGQPAQVPSTSLIPLCEIVDINPGGDGESFCVVMKYDGEDECYAFNGFSYLHSDLKNPNWKLGLGTYHIHLTLNASNAHKEFEFVLENKGKGLNDISITKKDCIVYL